MLTSPLAPYLYWAKTRPTAAIDLAGSNLLACSIDDVEGARDAVELTAPDKGGFPPLLEGVAAHYGVAGDRVALSSGCSAANFQAIGALAGPGSAVLMEAPWYDQIVGACRLVGARVEHFDRRFEDGYRIDVPALAARITPDTTLVIVTSPHNPSGMVIDTPTLEALQAMAEDADVFVLVDEVYLDATNLLHERRPGSARADGHYRPAALVGDRLLSISSLTKSYGLAGLRCGWVIGAAPVIERVRRVRDVVDNIGAAPADRIAALAFTQMDALGDRARQLVSTNLDLARQFLASHSQLDVAGPPEATIVFPKVAGVHNTDALVKRLFDEHGVAVAAGRFFGAPAHVRISLGGRTENLIAGLEHLGQVLLGL